ncbi:hypothetical protein FLJU110815_06540 [Flavobacterium jumunjinense]
MCGLFIETTYLYPYPIMKILFLSISISIIMLLSFFKKGISNHEINKFEIVNFYTLNNVSLLGNKNFNEVRIIRSKLIREVFTDVITKYQHKDTQCPDDITLEEKMFANNNINLIISKYSL